MEQGKFAPLTSAWKGAVACVVVVIIVVGLALFADSGWRLPVFQHLILEQWRTLLLWMFIGSIVVLIAFYVVIYLATKIRPEFIFGALVTIGVLLLISSQKGNLFSQYMYEWIDARWRIELLSASITVLSLALTFGAILVSINRTKK